MKKQIPRAEVRNKSVMKLIKQTKNNTCVPCVLAMIVGETEQYVLDWFDHQDPPFCDEDAFLFLAHHGVYLATGMEFKGGKKLSSKDTITLEVPLNNRMSYLIVKSPTKSLTHACLLFGGKVYDPLKDCPQKLENYSLLVVYPLMGTPQAVERLPTLKNSNTKSM